MEGRGMTLVEMLVVLVIIGILARLVIPNYLRSVEKGRSAEARHVLGLIRDAEITYYLDFDSYGSLAQLHLNYPAACDNPSYYFSYDVALASPASSFVASATRCTAGNSKPPVGFQSYVINITPAGALGGTAGFL